MPGSVTLDRAQREAVRRELGFDAHRCADIELYFDGGDRAETVRILALLSGLVAAMDVVGWQELPDAPDLQEVVVDGPLAVWAGSAADDVAQCLVDDIPLDPAGDLDALSALRLIAGVS